MEGAVHLRAATAASPPAAPRSPGEVLHLENLGDELRVYWRDGHCSQFLALWLRDNPPPVAGSHVPGPRRGDPGQLPDTLCIRDCDVDARGDVVLHFEPESLTLAYSARWLRRMGHPRQPADPDPRVAWDSGLEGEVPCVGYRQVQEDPRALPAWLAGIRRSGVGLLRGLPPKPGMMLRVVESFGFPRRIDAGACFTLAERPPGHYRREDTTACVLHTAAPYRDPPPGLRALHCLRRADHGGEAVLVDGLMAGGIVREHYPVYFGLLTRHAVCFERREARFHMRASRPLIEGDHRAPIRALHYDPVNAAPLDLPPQAMRDFYSAYCCLGRTINRIDLRLRMRLDSGDLLVLDNRRVLYGNAPFQGERVLESCYADWDGVDGRWRALDGDRG